METLEDDMLYFLCSMNILSHETVSLPWSRRKRLIDKHDEWRRKQDKKGK